VLVDNHEHPKCLTIGPPIRDEVIAPEVIPVTGAQMQARTVREPQAPTLELLLRYFES
jgi:hypothetical protein